MPTSLSLCQDFYNVLNVDPAATSTDIKKSWYRASLLLHPDKQRGLSSIQWAWQRCIFFKRGLSGAEEAFIVASQAYETLSDPEKRREHDETLRFCREGELNQSLTQRWLNRLRGSQGGPGSSFTSFAQTLDLYAGRIAFVTTPIRWFAQFLDRVNEYLQVHIFTLWDVIGLVFFLLFVAATVVPVIYGAAVDILMSPFRSVMAATRRATGAEERAKVRKEEGLRRARERQAGILSQGREGQGQSSNAGNNSLASSSTARKGDAGPVRRFPAQSGGLTRAHDR